MFSAGFLKKIFSAFILFIFSSAVILPQSNDNNAPKHGRHNIEFSLGLLNQMNSAGTVSISGVDTKTNGYGFFGALEYSYWLNNNFAFMVSAGMHSMDIEGKISSSGSISGNTGFIFPILFGLKYHPNAFEITDSFKPYVSGSVGVYKGRWAKGDISYFVGGETVSESALGARLGIGTDIFLLSWFKVGIGAGYHFISDFKNPIGSQKNYSGADFNFNFGFVF